MLGVDVRSDGLHVASLRVRGPTDALRARWRLESTLAEVGPSAIGLTLRAVLMVRRLAPPAHLSLNGASTLARYGPSVLSSLREMARSVRRPWLHADAGAAEVVLFADEAELVACLTSDWLHGAISERWWWRSILGDASPEQWLRERAIPRGEIVVAAMALLAAHNEAVHWCAKCGGADVERAVTAIAQAYGLNLDDASSEPAAAGSVPRVQNERVSGLEAPPGGPSIKQPLALRQLLASVPEARSPALAAPQGRLLALALAVSRTPAWVRTAALAPALRALESIQLAHDASAPPTVPPASAVDSIATWPGTSAASATASQQSKAHEAPDPNPSRPVDAARTRNIAEDEPQPAPRPGSVIPLDRSHRSRVAIATQVAPRDTSPGHPIADPVAIPPTAPMPLPLSAVNEAQQTVYAEPGLQAHTQYGGLFYLLNAALVLGIYGDFTKPLDPGLSLSPWNWLAIVGRYWFGTAFEQDALWPVLAALAGRRAGDPPDLGFAAPRQWTVEQAWLEPWGRVQEASYRVTATRLRAFHPVGFVLFDVPRAPHVAPAAQVRALCRSRASLRAAKLRRLPRDPCSTSHSGCTRWLKWLVSYLEARLARALAVDADAELPGLVCRYDATAAYSLTSVDVYMSLAALPLVIRIAGLDRDPGWIPAAGRTIAFHFQ